jgi:hypothetical protein
LGYVVLAPSALRTNALDASTLLAGSFKFLAPDDKRLRNTVLAIAEGLTENGFVLRYRTDETDDGLSGKEGTFLICSFWLVSAFAIVGEMQRAHDLMERLRPAKRDSRRGFFFGRARRLNCQFGVRVRRLTQPETRSPLSGSVSATYFFMRVFPRWLLGRASAGFPWRVGA